MYIKKLILLMTLTLHSFANESECPPDKIFNSKLNRCVLSQDSVKNKESFTACEGVEDREACIKQAAKERVLDTEDKFHKDIEARDLEKNNSKAKTADAAFSALSVYFLSAKDWSVGDMTMSSKVFGATSIAGLIKNQFFEKDIKKKVNKMTETFENEVSSDIGMKDAQVKAFDYLQAEQELISSHAKKQKSFYNIMSLGYLGAMGTAIYETYTSSMSCVKNKDASALSKISCPITLIPIAGLAAANAKKLANAADEQAKQANENVEKIKELKEKFIASIADYCPDGREDMSNPRCFCYLPDGEKNANRTNSQICQSEWDKYKNLYVETLQTQDSFSTENTEGCVYIDGKFDAECNCRKVKNSQGSNACMKVTLPGQSVSALGGINTSPAISEINKTLEGYSDVGTISPSIERLSAAGNAKRDQILKKVSKKLAEKGLSNPSKFAKDHNLALQKKFGNKLANPLRSHASSLDSTNRNGLSPEIKKALSSIETSAGLNTKVNKAKANIKQKKKNKNEWLDFGDNSGTAGQNVLEFSKNNHMNKKYKYQDNDITKDKNASIFKVISNRYNVSGLRRLFADE